MVIRKMTIEMFTLEIVYKDVIRTGITNNSRTVPEGIYIGVLQKWY